MGTLEEQNKAVIRRLYEEVMGKSNWGVADALFHPDYVDHLPIMVTPDRDGLLESVEVARHGFPDATAEFVHEIAEGDYVTIHVKVDAGAHKGTYLGQPPSGRPVTWTETHVWRVVDGKIAEHWGDFSLFQIMQQIGATSLSDTFAKRSS